MDFRERALFLLAFSAVLLPLIILSKDLFESAVFLVLYILAQLIMLYLFFRQEDTGFAEWYVFWAILAGMVFMLSMIIQGRSLFYEFLGFFLFLAYVISILIIAFRGNVIAFMNRPLKSKASGQGIQGPGEDDMENFRRKDELADLVEAFEISPPPKRAFGALDEDDGDSLFRPKREVFLEDEEESRVLAGKEDGGQREDLAKIEYDFTNFNIEDSDKDTDVGVDKNVDAGDDSDAEGDLLQSARGRASADEDERGADDGKIDFLEEKEDADRVEDHVEVFPKPAGQGSDLPQMREIYLDESNRVDFSKMKKNIESLDSGLKTLNEKIRLIGEKAILEAADKNIRLMNEKAVLEAADKKISRIKEGFARKETGKIGKQGLVMPKGAGFSGKESDERGDKKVSKEDREEPGSKQVYSSRTGSKYHHDRKCLSLKRVSKKDLVAFNDPVEARRKGLRPCSLCRKR
jgi:hypothetical protein